MNDTIAAISTPFGEGAIALLRLSGPRAVEIARGVFRGKKGAHEIMARVAQFGAIHDGKRKLDDVLLTIFRAPASYTGEDVVEIACHGGVLISRRILELQGNGNYDASQEFLTEYASIKPDLQSDLDRLGQLGIPVDVVFEQGTKVLGL